jgi:Protein of unknown function (DUF1236)
MEAQTMTFRTATIGAFAAGFVISGSAFAQTTTTTTTTITTEQSGMVRTYVTKQNRTSLRSPDQFGPGATVPSSFELYEIPADIGISNTRYTIINNRTVLIDPTTRRVIHVIE